MSNVTNWTRRLAKNKVRGNEHGFGPIAHDGCKGRLDLAPGAGVEDLNLQSDGARRFRHFPQHGLSDWRIGRIDQHGYPNGLGH